MKSTNRKMIFNVLAILVTTLPISHGASSRPKGGTSSSARKFLGITEGRESLQPLLTPLIPPPNPKDSTPSVARRSPSDTRVQGSPPSVKKGIPPPNPKDSTPSVATAISRNVQGQRSPQSVKEGIPPPNPKDSTPSVATASSRNVQGQVNPQSVKEGISPLNPKDSTSSVATASSRNVQGQVNPQSVKEGISSLNPKESTSSVATASSSNAQGQGNQPRADENPQPLLSMQSPENHKLLSVQVVTGFDNLEPYRTEVTASKLTNIFFRIRQINFNDWGMGKDSFWNFYWNKSIEMRPRSAKRHKKLAGILSAMYPQKPDLKNIVKFEVSRRDGSKEVMEDMMEGWDQPKLKKDPPFIKYEAVGLYEEAKDCPRFAMESQFVKENFSPSFKEEREFIERICPFQTPDIDESRLNDECRKLPLDQLKKRDYQLNKEVFDPREPFLLSQVMMVARTWDDFAPTWQRYHKDLREMHPYLPHLPKMSPPHFLIRLEQKFCLPFPIEDDAIPKRFGELNPSFFKKFHGLNLATTAMITLSAGLHLKRLLEVLTDPAHPNHIFPMEESMVRAFVIALAGEEFYNRIEAFGYASVLICEKYRNAQGYQYVRLLFAPSVDELDRNMRSEDGQKRLIVEKSVREIQEFVGRIERKFIPEIWQKACKTDLFQQIVTVGDRKYSQGLNVYGNGILVNVPTTTKEKAEQELLLEAYQKRKKFFVEKPKDGYPSSTFKNRENKPIF